MSRAIPRGRFATRLAVGLVLAAGLAACQPSDPPRDEAGPSTSASDDWCQSRPETVTCLEHDGQLIGLVRRAGEASGMVLWDPGGPGVALPDDETPLDRIIPAALAERNVLLVLEPWVRTPPEAACLASGAVENIRSGSCDLARLISTRESLARAVAVAESETGLGLTGAYLQSFGATRTLPELLSGRLGDPRWVVLESPGPPAGTSAGDLMGARASKVVDVLAGTCATDECRRAVRQFMTKDLGAGPEGRETALGLIALASLPSANHAAMERFGAEVSAGGLSPDTRRGIAKLGRQYSGQLHGGGLPPWLVALWADTCPRLSGWTELEERRSPLEAAYAWLFRGCRAAAGLPKFDAETLGPGGPPVLMLTGRQDAVVPPSMQRRWLSKGLTPTTLQGAEHGWQTDRSTQPITEWIERQESRRKPR